MKNNQPVTRQEVPFPRDSYLVSKTDLKGVITHCNDAFVQISGFSREELIGASHNIVRHPEMPQAAFDDLWRTVKAGLPWRGLVKNRCKNGDFYWVDAFVMPISKNGQAVGYMSVRTPPDAARKAEAEQAYAAAGAQGKLPATALKTRMTVKARLWASQLMLVSLICILGVLGLTGLKQSNSAIDDIYENNLQPSNAINRVMFLLADNRSQVMLALQHDETNPNSKLHDHPLDLHIDNTLKNREEINRLIEQLKQYKLTEDETKLLGKFGEARERFSKEGVNVARDLLKDGKYVEANRVLLTNINPLYRDMQKDGDALIKALSDGASAQFKQADKDYGHFRNLTLALLIGAVFIAICCALVLVRAVIHPMEQAKAYFARMSEGDLTDRIDVTGRDETGRLLCDLATMQANIRAMLDEIKSASNEVERRSTELNDRMNQVAAQSMEQQSSVESVAAATEEFSQSVQEVASNAGETATAARVSQEQVAQSNHSIQESMAATSRVVDAVQSSNQTIGQLNLSIAKIGDITQVIADIASQTNLLALNAAIEAARAGEQGRGFAVVADEVRKLAERTTTSTADINKTVLEIQAATRKTVESMDLAAKEVETGIDTLRTSVTGLDGITASSQRVAEMSGHISDAAQQQGVASEEVARNMQRVTELINSNAETAGTAKSSADQLRETSLRLDLLIASFRLYR